MLLKTLGSFSYLRPGSVQETLRMLREYRGRSRILAGGTDLFVMLRKRTLETNFVIDIKNLEELHRISWDYQKGLSIGSACPISEIEKSPLVARHAPVLLEATRTFANAQVRNRATIGGNIARSSPAGDLLPVLLVLGTKIHIVGQHQEKILDLADFFTGPGQNILSPDELILSVVIPPHATGGTAFNKMMRTADDLAKLNVAVYVEVAGGKILKACVAMGAVASTPKRLRHVEEILTGVPISAGMFDKVATAVKTDIAPITDVRSTREYRLEVAGVAVKRTLERALEGVR